MGDSDYWHLPHATLIIQEYEKAAAKAISREMNRNAALVQFKSGLQAMDMSLKISEEVLMHAAAMDVMDQGSPEDEDDWDWKVGSAPDAEWEDKTGFAARSRWERAPVVACDKETQSDNAGSVFDPEKKFVGFRDDDGRPLGEVPGWKVEAEVNWGKGLGLTEEDMQYVNECWNCNPFTEFDWQVQPLNAFKVIEELLQQIESIIDGCIARFKASAEWIRNLLCSLFSKNPEWGDWKLGRLICPTTWAALLAALQALLAKYQVDLIKFKLDWTALVGPILAHIVQVIVSLIEAIYALIVPFIDCIIGAFQAIDAVIDGVQAVADEAHKFGNYLVTNRNPIVAAFPGNKSDAQGGSFSWTDREKRQQGKSWWQSVRTKHMNPLSYPKGVQLMPDYKDDKGKVQRSRVRPKVTPGENSNLWATGLELGGSNQDVPLADPNQFKGHRDPWFEAIGDDYFEPNKNMSAKQKKARNDQLTGLKPLIKLLNDVKRWIRKLFDNIKNLFISLKQFFNGNLSVTFAVSGAAMFLIDIAALITEIILFNKRSNYCEEHPYVEGEARDLLSEYFFDVREDPDVPVKIFGAVEVTEDGSTLTATSRSGLFDWKIARTACTNTIPGDNNTETIERIFEAMSENNQYRDPGEM